MGDFEPRMDKWGEREVSSLAHQLKDSIVNKGRQEKDRRRAKRAAEHRAARRTKWRHSALRRWLHRLIVIVALIAAWVFAWSELMG